MKPVIILLLFAIPGILFSSCESKYEKEEKEDSDRFEAWLIYQEYLKQESCNHPESIPVHRSGDGLCVHKKAESGMIYDSETLEAYTESVASDKKIRCFEHGHKGLDFNPGNVGIWYKLHTETGKLKLITEQGDETASNGFTRLDILEPNTTYYCVDESNLYYQVIEVTDL